MSRTSTLGVVKGAAAGLVGGIVATLVMDQFQILYSAASLQVKKAADPTAARIQQQQEHDEASEGATARMADRVARAATGTALTKEQRVQGGSAVHWIFGASMGAIYGAVAEIAPVARSGMGLAYGTALWAGADEIGVPAFKLGPTPEKTPPEKHATEWAAHLVYGTALELTRRLVRGLL